MNLIFDLKEAEIQKAKSSCGVCRIIDSLSVDEQAALIMSIETRVVRDDATARVLRKNGYETSESSIRRHRSNGHRPYVAPEE